ncbi:tRNA epoxyqueuosine(34) reductase QueG [Granulicella arctica]|uniref:tRNA epoxyqueuosine(34) reductase QueG n=1 Tax=Granulicella arctica TaxID=940613 RepID=UPI0021E07809|nr:tRNA epoxyqueuosine(34) reductase QueG [Granulicella arctica]
MPAEWTPTLHQRVLELAASAGFDTTGIASATSTGTETAERFTTWVAAGHAGEMDYLKRRDEQGTLLRTAVQVAIPWARSIIVCAINYNADAPRSIDPAPDTTGWIARYAWSGKDSEPSDYHDDLLARLRQIEAGLLQQTTCETRCYVDTGPLIERSYAAKSGVGWVGKNTCILNQQLGSWLLLGVIVTSLALPESVISLEAQDRCGSCTRCIDACPTNALIAPHQMDASLCIAYLTIEKKGTIPESLRPLIGRQVFGCDICQDVCPWNRKAPIASGKGTGPLPELINPALEWLAQMDAATFKRHFKGSPLERTKRHRLHRNVAIAMGNSGNPAFLPQLEAWQTSEDPILAEHAQWAIKQLIKLSS